MFLGSLLGGAVGWLLGNKKQKPQVHHTVETRIIEKASNDPFIQEQRAKNIQIDQQIQNLIQSGDNSSQRIQKLEEEKQRIEQETLTRFVEIQSEFDKIYERLQVHLLLLLKQ